MTRMRKMNNQTAWWKKSVVYQIYPKSFYDSDGDGFGDLNGIREKLSYLEKLGVDVIWLNPIYESPQVDNGYDISNYKKIEPQLGTMEDFDMLLKEAHEKGIRIILDLVVNHTSDKHPWFTEAKKGKENPYHDYYIWKDTIPNNWGSSFGGPAWEYVEETAQYYLHLFAKEQPDLNWENPKVRKEVQEILRFWLEKGIDGFRMDVITLISKDPAYPDGPVIQNKAYGSYYAGCASGPRVHEYLQEMNREVLSKYDIMNVGEAPHTSADEAAPYTVIKVKMGRDNDKELVEIIRSKTDKPLCVDANQGWTDKEKALDMCHWLKERGWMFVEQPFDKKMIDETAWLRERSPLPIIADEFCQRIPDVMRAYQVYDGINIKLMKSTGLHEAYKMAVLAKSLGMKLMIGCMTETSCAISAAAQLAPMADWVDLDGNLLIANDSFDGVKVVDGKITLTDKPGIGATPIK